MIQSVSSDRGRWLCGCAALAVVLVTGAVLASDADGTGVALESLDPILLIQGDEQQGSKAYESVHEDLLYRFVSAKNKRRFDADPARYGIQLGGECGAMPGARGNPSRWAVLDEKIYIFGSDACRESFTASPETYLEARKEAKMQVAIVLFDGVELLDFAGPGEVFAAAQRHGFEVFTVADAARPVISQGFVEVTPSRVMGGDLRPDIIVVPGGGVGSLLDSEAAMNWLREAGAEAEHVMSVCNGALALARLGMLDGLEATTHHGSIDSLRKMAKKTTVFEDRRFIDNGKIITTAGVSAGIDGALHLLRRLRDHSTAESVARYMEYDWRPEQYYGDAAEVASRRVE